MIFDQIEISLPIKALLSIQVTITLTVVYFSGIYISTITDPFLLLIEFIGLIVVLEMDNWAAAIFEVHLDNYYHEIKQQSKYLTFETSQNNKNSAYIFTMFTLAF